METCIVQQRWKGRIGPNSGSCWWALSWKAWTICWRRGRRQSRTLFWGSGSVPWLGRWSAHQYRVISCPACRKEAWSELVPDTQYRIPVTIWSVCLDFWEWAGWKAVWWIWMFCRYRSVLLCFPLLCRRVLAGGEGRVFVFLVVVWVGGRRCRVEQWLGSTCLCTGLSGRGTYLILIQQWWYL